VSAPNVALLAGKKKRKETHGKNPFTSSLPPSALTEFETQDDSDEDDDATVTGGGPVNDDERSGTRYNYSFFHIIFVLATMYTACLLTNW
jgi:hypothetical protein